MKHSGKSSNHGLLSFMERIRITANHRTRDWLEVLEIFPEQYENLDRGPNLLSESQWENVGRFLEIDPENLISRKVDWDGLTKREAKRAGKDDSVFPERYSIAMFGRCRATIDSLAFVEKRSGWKVRKACLDRLGVSEGSLTNPLAPISMQLPTDIFSLLKSDYGYKSRDFFRMGARSAYANRNTVLASVLSASRSPSQIYERLFGDLQKFYEQNCRYVIKRLGTKSCVVEIHSDPHIASALKTRYLGSQQTCQMRIGVLASATQYLGLPIAKVSETHCEHRGDPHCRVVIDFSEAEAIHKQ